MESVQSKLRYILYYCYYYNRLSSPNQPKKRSRFGQKIEQPTKTRYQNPGRLAAIRCERLFGRLGRSAGVPKAMRLKEKSPKVRNNGSIGSVGWLSADSRVVQDRLSEFEIIYGLQRAKLQPREWEAASAVVVAYMVYTAFFLSNFCWLYTWFLYVISGSADFLKILAYFSKIQSGILYIPIHLWFQ